MLTTCYSLRISGKHESFDRISSPISDRLETPCKKYRSLRHDYARFLEELKNNTAMGINLGGGVRKIRFAIASKGKGKSGGARAITLVVHSDESGAYRVTLLTLYDKNEMVNVSDTYIKYLISTIE